MSEKRMFIVPGELMARIDAHRGEMSRAEFVDHCIEGFLQGEASDQGTDLRKPETCQRPTEGFFGASLFRKLGVQISSLAADTEPDQPKTLGCAEEASAGVKMETAAFSWLWIPALLLFGFGDTLTSHLVFAAGGREANPFLGGLIGLFGGGMVSFVLVKTILLVALLLLSTFALRRHTSIVPAVLIGLGTYLVVHNLLSLSQLTGIGSILSGLGLILGGAV